MRPAFLLLLFLLLPAAGQLREPSQTQGKLAVGTVWETPFYEIDSGVKGPIVLIVGGMHGNEPAGSLAAEQIRHWPVAKGKLVVLPRANVLALKANKRLSLDQPVEKGNLNRNFPQEGKDIVPRTELAKAMWRFAFQVKPDWVIDLHEGFEFNRSHKPAPGKKKSVGSSIIYRDVDAMHEPVAKAIAAADAHVTDPAKRFVKIPRGPVTTGFARACINLLGAEGLILETTYTDQAMSLRTRQHRAMVNVLLKHIGTIERDCADVLVPQRSAKVLRVGVFDGAGTGSSKTNIYQVVRADAGLAMNHIGPDEMRADVLRQFDVVIFPGGSGSKQGKDLGEKGRAAVQEYVKGGGGVLGVCAGAYLCSSHYSWSLGLVDSTVFTGSVEVPGMGKKSLWHRGGRTRIQLELTEGGKQLYGPKGIPEAPQIIYANGPIISPKKCPEVEDYEVLAWFRTENAKFDAQKGTMVNTPAVVSSRFGKGRVISMSPHPELTPGLHPMITQSIRWAGGRVGE